MADPIVEVVELLADPVPRDRQPALELPPGVTAGPRREQEGHRGADDRPHEEAKAEAPPSARRRLVGFFWSVHPVEAS